MESVTVHCNGCGAVLVVGKTTRFATCIACDAHLAVKHSATALYTEAVDDLHSLKKELARIDEAVSFVEAEAAPARPNNETVLRLVVGALLIASDLFWLFTDPSLQSLYVRIIILAAGLWLLLSGVVKVVAAARDRVHRFGARRHALEAQRTSLASTIAKLDRELTG